MMTDAEDNGGKLVDVATVFLAITWVSVLLRGFVRIHITKSFQADDWLMTLSQILFSLTCIFSLIGVHYGVGQHDATLSSHGSMEALKYESLAVLFYILDVMCIKLSIAVFLLRIAVKIQYKWILKISMVIVTLWSLAIFFFELFRCIPIHSQWNPSVPHTCVSGQSLRASSYALSIMTILSDFLYALLPIPMIWSVQMTKQAKVTVAFILSLGIFASIATLIRMKYLFQIADVDDILFAAASSMTWTIVEPGLAITAASLVTIRPLLRLFNITGFKSSDATCSRPTQPQNISLRNGIPLQMKNSRSSQASQRHQSSWPLKSTARVNTGNIDDGGSEEYILQGIGLTRISGATGDSGIGT